MQQKERAPLEATKERTLFWAILAGLYVIGYGLSVGANLYFGSPLRQALLRSLATMLVVVGMQFPLWLWYRVRLKGKPGTKP